ncbi:MAG: protein sorting system archaetidylserine synthase [Halanaeroarchaeum sp.]
MRPRFVGRVGAADVLTVSNAAVGFLAVVTATTSPRLAARIVLFGAILDALDGIVARRRGSSDIGPHLDSLADTATFGVAPAFIVFTVGRNAGFLESGLLDHLLWIGVPAVFVATGVLRLSLYTAYDVEDTTTEGVQTTLASTIVSASLLSGVPPATLVFWLGILAIGMLAPVTYPDLRVRDAVVMGAIQGVAVLFPAVANRLFPRVLLIWALGYLLFAPTLYRRDEGKRS